MRRNSRADGGSVNGSEQAAFRAKVEELMDDGYDFGEAVREAMRQGYDKGGEVRKIYKVVREITDVDRIQAANKGNPIPKDAKFKIQLPGSKMQGGKGGSSTTQIVYGKTKKELNEALKKSEKLTKSYVKPRLPKNDPTSPLYEPPFERADKFLVVKTRGPTVDNIKKIKYEEVIGSKNQPNTFKPTGKIVTKYKPFVGPDKVTIPGQGADTLKEAQKFVKKYFKENPKQIRVRDPKKDYASKDVREKALKETDPTKAKGTKKFNYHHVRQIAGGVPLTTDDVMIINQRINSALGTKYNKPLNSISAAIQKNNRLALEAMNAKQEGLALDYMKRVDNLNDQAEKIVNSAIDDLPKKYKGYVGFNQFELPRDEYGLPIGNEPMKIKKVGGMPVSKNAVDLTMLNLKEEKKFKQIVSAQAKAGKVGPINKILKNAGKVLSGASKVAKPLSLVVGPYAVMSAAAKADDMDIKLGLGDQAAAFLMGDPQAAIDMYKMRNDPEYAQQVRAANYARPLDEGTYDAIDESFTSYFDGGIVSVLKGVK